MRLLNENTTVATKLKPNQKLNQIPTYSSYLFIIFLLSLYYKKYQLYLA